MFWVDTAPTPAAACAHRAATAALEDETAMPNIPVLLQRPTMEKVICWTEPHSSGPHHFLTSGAHMVRSGERVSDGCWSVTAKKTLIDTLVVGAGQAGIAMSEHLSRHAVPHLVL